MKAFKLKIFDSLILSEAQFRMLLDFFSEKPLLQLLFVGSQNDFSSLKFHE